MFIMEMVWKKHFTIQIEYLLAVFINMEMDFSQTQAITVAKEWIRALTML
jgi:hypothetical protein